MAVAKTWPLFVATVAVGAVALALAANGTTSAADASVGIQDFSFSPASVTVNVGDTVTWTNNEGFHTVDSTDGGPLASGGTIPVGESYAYTFAVPGVYEYWCAIHGSFMTGSVTVLGPGGTPPTPTPTETPPPTDTPTSAPTAGGTPPSETPDPTETASPSPSPSPTGTPGGEAVAAGMARDG